MASSNRHWPSMFKSKPCNTHHHDFNSSSCKSNPFPPPPPRTVVEVERTPEPKPRWNPKPEQIRILEAIFNSGMVNPPREEIKKIRAQLQEYGQVGDANVFYWFQNRKSRSKQKNRHHPHNNRSASSATAPPTPPLAPVGPTSSSDRSSPNSTNNHTNKIQIHDISNFNHHHNPNDPYLPIEAVAPATALPFFFPVHQQNGAPTAPGLCFNEFGGGGGVVGGFHNFSSEVVNPVPAEGPMGTFSGLLFGDMMGGNGNGNGPPRRSMFEEEDEGEKLRFQAEDMSFLVTNPTNTNPIVPPTSATPPMISSFSQLQGGGGTIGQLMGPAAKSTVFINDMTFEVPAVGPFNVREAFGDDYVLLHQSGHPVATNEWGLTVHPLQHGASYFLARTLGNKQHHAAPHHLLPASEFPFQL